MTSSQAVCETNMTNEWGCPPSPEGVRQAIREDTVLLEIITRAAEMDAQPAGVVSAVKRVVGLGHQVDRAMGTIYSSQARTPRGRHERPSHGKHAFRQGTMRAGEVVRPKVPKPRGAAHVPQHAVVAVQEHTVLMPVVARHPPAHRREEQKQPGTQRVVAAGLGAAAVACTGMAFTLTKGSEGKFDTTTAFSFPWQSVNTPPDQRRADVRAVPSRPSRASGDRSKDAPPSTKPVPVPTRANTAFAHGLASDKTLTGPQKAAMRDFAEAITSVPAADLKGVCASALMAKAVVISGWGQSSASKNHNNPFELRNSKGVVVAYPSLSQGLAAQARRIKASPYYNESRLFPGQAPDSCAADGRTYLLAAKTSKEARVNLIFSFFKRKDLSEAQIAGLVGNFQMESGINPERIQTVGGSAKGMAQWEGNRFAPRPGSSSNTLGLKAFAAQQGKSWTNFRVQLEYIWYEFLHHEKRAYKQIKAADTATESSIAVTNTYERPSRNPRTLHMKERIQSSEQAYKAHVKDQQQVRATHTLMKKSWFGNIFSKRTNVG